LLEEPVLSELGLLFGEFRLELSLVLDPVPPGEVAPPVADPADVPKYE
jgi:hypothetical protein